MKYGFTKRDLQVLETIEQSWSGDELKIEMENVRVWLTHSENRKYDGDYQVEVNVNGKWMLQQHTFEH